MDVDFFNDFEKHTDRRLNVEDREYKSNRSLNWDDVQRNKYVGIYHE